MDVSARPAPGRDIPADDFRDLTGSPVESIRWNPDGEIVVTFTDDLADETVAAVRRRIQSRNHVEEELQARAEQALINNREYLALTAPTAAQVKAQTDALTRQVNALIRLATGRIEAAD